MDFKSIKLLQALACIPMLVVVLLMVNDFGLPDVVKTLSIFFLIIGIVVSMIVGKYECPNCGEKFHLKKRPDEGTLSAFVTMKGYKAIRNSIVARFVPFARKCVHCKQKPE